MLESRWATNNTSAANDVETVDKNMKSKVKNNDQREVLPNVEKSNSQNNIEKGDNSSGSQKLENVSSKSKARSQWTEADQEEFDRKIREKLLKKDRGRFNEKHERNGKKHPSSNTVKGHQTFNHHINSQGFDSLHSQDSNQLRNDQSPQKNSNRNHTPSRGHVYSSQSDDSTRSSKTNGSRFLRESISTRLSTESEDLVPPGPMTKAAKALADRILLPNSTDSTEPTEPRLKSTSKSKPKSKPNYQHERERAPRYRHGREPRNKSFHTHADHGFHEQEKEEQEDSGNVMKQEDLAKMWESLGDEPLDWASMDD
ncbi:predicted protein [Lodderomyces elongisporus NRRL YB-4239]|uniref:Uncharacterized protein n=1 Tax=Lodderomyces elongisporus (strain ATCC 11503 / CBS 2605 / JCM 1781 / NBRC 1676 / NRRL YB-4239) TaxID=379508 RepID=A5E0S7_LODEL|nr:predicted protein [Lodderomyces elongisporus NRRL YB-4239]